MIGTGDLVQELGGDKLEDANQKLPLPTTEGPWGIDLSREIKDFPVKSIKKEMSCLD